MSILLEEGGHRRSCLLKDWSTEHLVDGQCGEAELPRHALSSMGPPGEMHLTALRKVDRQTACSRVFALLAGHGCLLICSIFYIKMERESQLVSPRSLSANHSFCSAAFTLNTRKETMKKEKNPLQTGSTGHMGGKGNA